MFNILFFKTDIHLLDFFSIHRFRHHKRTKIPRVNKMLPIIIKDNFDMVIENLHSLINKLNCEFI